MILIATYISPSLEPIGGSPEASPLVTLGPVVAAAAGAVVVAAAAAAGGAVVVVYGVAATPCGPYW